MEDFTSHFEVILRVERFPRSGPRSSKRTVWWIFSREGRHRTRGFAVLLSSGLLAALHGGKGTRRKKKKKLSYQLSYPTPPSGL